MLATIRQALTPPAPQDGAEFNIQAHLLHSMIAVLWLANAATFIVSLFWFPEHAMLSAFLLAFLLTITLSFALLRRGQTDLAAKLAALVLWVLGMAAVFAWRAITPATTITFAVSMITSALLLTKRLSLTLSLLNIVVCALVLAATELGLWPDYDASSLTLSEFAMLTAGLLVITVVLTNARDSLTQMVRRARAIAYERGTLIEQLETEIEERKRVEQALRASQGILKEAKRIAKLGTFSLAPAPAALTFSEQAHLILGLEPKEPITPELSLERFGIDLVTRLTLGMERITATGRPLDFNHDITMADGSVRTLHFSARAVENGEPFIGIIQDISDRTVTEKVMQRLNDELTDTVVELEREQNLLRAVLDAIPERVFWKDLDLRYLGCNQALADDAGIPLWKDVVGKYDYELPWAADADRHRADDRRIIETGEPRLNTEELTTIQTWVRSSKVPLRNKQGEIIGVLGTYDDITEQKHMEQALRENEAALNMAQEIAKMGSFEFNTATKTIHFSDELYRIFELEPGSNVSMESLARLIGADYSRLAEYAFDATETGEAYEVEYEMEFASGEKKTLYAYSRPLEDVHGKLSRVFGAVQDITERRRVETERERLAAIISNSSDVIVVADINGEALYVNPAGLEALQYEDPDEYLHRSVSIFHDATSAAFIFGEAVPEAMNKGTWRGECKMMRKDGTLFDVDQTLFAVRDAEGEAYGIAAICRDITDRKRAEQALRESEARYASLVNRAHDGVLVVQDMRMIFLNKAAADLIGGTVEDLQGQPYANFVAPEFRDTVLGYIDARMHGQAAPALYETKLRRVDGTIFDAEISAALVMQDGRPASMGLLRDISERKRAQQALRESEARFRALFEQLPLGAYLIGGRSESEPYSRVIDCNNAAAEMNGFTREELIGIRAIDLLADTSQFEGMEHGHVWQKIRDQGSITLDVEYLRKGGSTYPAQATASILRIQGQEMMLIVERDVTEAKRAEHALRASEERFRTLFQQLPLGAFLTAARSPHTKAAIIVDCNDAAARMNGFSREELIGRPIDVLMVNRAEIREEVRRVFWDQVREQGFFTLEDDRERKDGSIYPAQSISSIMNVDGEDMMLIIERDITESRRAEQALRDSENHFRRLAEDTPAFVCKFLQDSTLTYVNSTYAAYFGGDPEEFIGQRFLEMLPDDLQRQNTLTQYLSLTCDNPTTSYEEHVFAPDGSARWQQWTDRALCDEKGAITGYQSIGIDITPRKRAESERESLIVELEAKNAELERFTYTVSHDLKSPLITIRGFLGYLESDARNGNFERMSADIERIGNATVKMERLLNELLELSRIGRKTNPPEFTPFEHIVHEGMEMAQGRLKARSVTVEIVPNSPPLYGDRVRLIEVIQNLIDNAAKFLGDQPNPLIEVGARVEGANTVTYVRDNGIGIESQYHDKVFGLFDKLDNDSEGTGVGLALVKRIIEVHGGKIWVESAGRGQGTTFWFTLPNTPAI
ncbi:MAG: PAS domain S-box protein [Anaerolineae bacterium]|nr:PAS domain S-box protein [Anaerolineae bacterium]